MSARFNRQQPSPISQLLGPDADQAPARQSSYAAQAVGQARANGPVALHYSDHELVRHSLALQDEFVSASEPSNSPLDSAPVARVADDRRRAPRQLSTALVSVIFRLVEVAFLLSLIALFSMLYLVTGGDHLGAGVPIALLLGILVFASMRLTAKGRSPDPFSPLGNLSSKLAVWLSVSLTTALLAWGLQPDQSLLPIHLATWVFLGALVVYGMHGASGWAWRRLATARRLAKRRVAIVGASSQAAHLIARLHEPDAAPLFDIVGIFDDRFGGNRLPPGRFAGEWLSGRVGDLLERNRSEPLDIIVVALPHNAVARLNEIVDKLGDVPAHFRLCPDLVNFDTPLNYAAGAEDLTGFLQKIYTENYSQLRYFIKAVQDRFLAALMLLLLGPLMLLVALLIRIDSPGPVLFKQKRFGLWNRPIEVLKFRTMFHHRCDPTGSTQTVRDDARVTRVGRFLRRSSMDELPQILNVLRGEMSFVGPRPHPILMRVGDIEYKKCVPLYAVRHRLKPGITGLAQINGLRGEVNSIEKAKKVLEMDLRYVRNWSLFLDLKIIIKTVFVFLRDPKAY